MEDKFSKDMLESGKHIVVLRNGRKCLYLNNCFITHTKCNKLIEYKEDLKHVHDRDYDVMEVYCAKEECSFSDILFFLGEKLWKRNDPLIITKEKALETLKALYGEEVKVEW